MDLQVKVEMRNVRRQLGIQNWDLDVPMVVENRFTMPFNPICPCINLIWISGQEKATHFSAPTHAPGAATGENY